MARFAAASRGLRGPFKRLATMLQSAMRNPPRVPRVGDVGMYGPMRRGARGTGLDMDHIPSNASNLAAAQARKGAPLTALEREAVQRSGATLAVRRSWHQRLSATFGGRNNASQIAADAANPAAAIRRDFNRYRSQLLADGFDNDQIEALYDSLVRQNQQVGRL